MLRNSTAQTILIKLQIISTNLDNKSYPHQKPYTAICLHRKKEILLNSPHISHSDIHSMCIYIKTPMNSRRTTKKKQYPIAAPRLFITAHLHNPPRRSRTCPNPNYHTKKRPLYTLHISTVKAFLRTRIHPRTRYRLLPLSFGRACRLYIISNWFRVAR